MPRNQRFYFLLLMAGRLTSSSGSFFDLVAINLFALKVTGSPTITGLLMAVRILTAALASPYLGSLADRIDRKRGMIASDLILATALLFLSQAPEKPWIVIPSLFVIQALLGMFQNFFGINFQAALPNFAPDGNLVWANSVFQVVSSLSLLIGSLGAAVAIPLVGYRGAFLIDAATYLVSAGILFALPLRTQERGRPGVAPVQEGFAGGLRFLARYAPHVFLLVAVRCLDGIGSGSHNVALPPFSAALDAASPSLVYGLILTAWAFGGILGAVAMNRWENRLRNLGTLFLGTTFLMCVSWVAIFQTERWFWIGGSALVAGIFDTLATVSYSLLLQRTADSVRGRVMGLSAVVLNAGWGGGMALAALMLGAGVPIPLLVLFWHGIPMTLILLLAAARIRWSLRWPALALEEGTPVSRSG